MGKQKSKYFVRICADSPLLDTQILDKIVNFSKKNDYDVITNVYPRSFPKGQSIEILNKNMFIKNFPLIKNKYDQEHVTTYFYRNSKNFKIKNFLYKKNFSKINLSIDNPRDLIKLEKVIKKIIKKYNSNFSIKNLISCV